jgi:hypothetical protein
MDPRRRRRRHIYKFRISCALKFCTPLSVNTRKIKIAALDRDGPPAGGPPQARVGVNHPCAIHRARRPNNALSLVFLSGWRALSLAFWLDSLSLSLSLCLYLEVQPAARSAAAASARVHRRACRPRSLHPRLRPRPRALSLLLLACEGAGHPHLSTSPPRLHYDRGHPRALPRERRRSERGAHASPPSLTPPSLSLQSLTPPSLSLQSLTPPSLSLQSLIPPSLSLQSLLAASAGAILHLAAFQSQSALPPAT